MTVPTGRRPLPPRLLPQSKSAQLGVGCFGLWFMVCALAALAMLGLISWAVVELVMWVTTK